MCKKQVYFLGEHEWETLEEIYSFVGTWPKLNGYLLVDRRNSGVTCLFCLVWKREGIVEEGP